MIVDDEQHIVKLASAALRRAGFETIEATSGQSALELWRENDNIDLLLTDCVMPDLFGDQLAARLQDLNPKLSVVFMSGNPAGSLELSCPVVEHVNFVQKPFDFETLISTVRRALAGVVPREKEQTP